jgi:flavin reductase (DIM6/NTAB) family NADH-FMN oxidoreductase RutF
MATYSLSPEVFRRVMGSFATGVTVITVERAPALVHGMTANSFTSVSLDPLLVLICVDHNARLLSYLKNQRRFAVNILQSTQRAISEYFAKPQQDPALEAQLGVRFAWSSSGIPLLADTLAQIACSVVAEHEAGDHTVFIGEVESLDSTEGEPLLYYRGHYRGLQET